MLNTILYLLGNEGGESLLPKTRPGVRHVSHTRVQMAKCSESGMSLHAYESGCEQSRTVPVKTVEKRV